VLDLHEGVLEEFAERQERYSGCQEETLAYEAKKAHKYLERLQIWAEHQNKRRQSSSFRAREAEKRRLARALKGHAPSSS
jgi:hypothetical protein